MKTECTAGQLEFHCLGRRVVVGQFDGGKIFSYRGGLLLREVEQRAMGLALGYGDINDHDALRHDLLLALISDMPGP